MARIVVVEDDKQISSALIEALEEADYEVVELSGGQEAMDYLRENGADLIYLDIMMPKVDGYQVLQWLKADEERSKIPVVILSVLGQPDEIDKAMKLGANGYLVKANVDLHKVVETVGEYVGGI